MSALSDLRSLTAQQRNVVIASFLGWMLDAFDFFILVFVMKYVAEEFGTDIASVTIAITLTLAMRPVGAVIFGYLAEKFGRRPTLMINIMLYAGIEFASGFAPTLTVLIILRALYGVAMGGEWGVGASLTMESIPPKMRGLVSGLLQAGYPAGYLIASLVFFLLFPVIGWRGMFMLGALPALLVLYIRSNVEESPVFMERKSRTERISTWSVLKQHARLFVYAVLLMTAFNFFSHGTQDLYPTFLEVQKNLSTTTVGTIAVIYNIGAILGGITFGMFSEKIGRRRGIVIAALLALPVIPLWVYSSSPALLATGAFLMQFAVQGAWGIVPAHLNELSPDELRSTFPGLVYQLGNLIAAANATMQAGLAEHYNNDYAFSLALFVAVVAIIVALLAGFGTEAKGVLFGKAAPIRR
ncbi:MFS transporter [Phyllobacterium salinisoli]|uniref:MFS transporter n=1 Tax=Phyllobacterium salinisoli TaxID=1899321 RepID=A0A368JZL6_9HYPH|nr:MFS transporter [Phyllobacterium salinisoli]RCS21865.1 MFS transporter [Phyllobacterium salinisoli]